MAHPSSSFPIFRRGAHARRRTPPQPNDRALLLGASRASGNGKWSRARRQHQVTAAPPIPSSAAEEGALLLAAPSSTPPISPSFSRCSSSASPLRRCCRSRLRSRPSRGRRTARKDNGRAKTTSKQAAGWEAAGREGRAASTETVTDHHKQNGDSRQRQGHRRGEARRRPQEHHRRRRARHRRACRAQHRPGSRPRTPPEKTEPRQGTRPDSQPGAGRHRHNTALVHRRARARRRAGPVAAAADNSRQARPQGGSSPGTMEHRGAGRSHMGSKARTGTG